MMRHWLQRYRLKHWQLNSLSLYLSSYLAMSLSIYTCIYLSISVCLSLLSIFIYISIFIRLSISLYLSPSLSTHLSIYPSIYWQKSLTLVAILLSFSYFTSSSRCNPYFPRVSYEPMGRTSPRSCLRFEAQVFSILDVTQAGGEVILYNRIGPLLVVG